MASHLTQSKAQSLHFLGSLTSLLPLHPLLNSSSSFPTFCSLDPADELCPGTFHWPQNPVRSWPGSAQPSWGPQWCHLWSRWPEGLDSWSSHSCALRMPRCKIWNPCSITSSKNSHNNNLYTILATILKNTTREALCWKLQLAYLSPTMTTQGRYYR